jgi:hypothetical protein
MIGVACVAIGAALALNPVLTLVVLGVVGLVVLAVVRPQWLAVAVVVGILTLDGVAQLSTSLRLVVWLKEISVLLLFASATIRSLRQGRMVRPILLAPVLAIVAVCLVSAFLNAVPVLTLVLGLRNYLRYALVYLAIVQSGFSESQRRGLLAAMLAIAVLQIPVSAFQFFFTSHGNPDLITGTLGPGMSGVLTLWLTLCAALVLSRAVSEKRFSRPGVLMVLALFIPTLLNETKVSFFLTPVMGIWVGTRQIGWRRVGRALLVMMLVALVVLTSLGVYQRFYSGKVYDIDYVRQYLTAEYETGGRLNRLSAAGLATELVGRTSQSFVIGYGPGTASASSIAGGAGRVFNEFGLLSIDDTFLARYTIELGILGWFALLALVFSSYLLVRRARQGRVGPWWLAAAESALFAGLVEVALSFYTATWIADSLALFFWLSAALAESAVAEAKAQGGHHASEGVLEE